MNARNLTDFLPLAGMLEVAGVGVEVPGRSLLQAVSDRRTESSPCRATSSWAKTGAAANAATAAQNTTAFITCSPRT